MEILREFKVESEYFEVILNQIEIEGAEAVYELQGYIEHEQKNNREKKAIFELFPPIIRVFFYLRQYASEGGDWGKYKEEEESDASGQEHNRDVDEYICREAYESETD